ncbi:MAG: zinc ribbon domain-containing protein [Phycisphaerales bacterium]
MAQPPGRPRRIPRLIANPITSAALVVLLAGDVLLLGLLPDSAHSTVGSWVSTEVLGRMPRSPDTAQTAYFNEQDGRIVVYDSFGDVLPLVSGARDTVLHLTYHTSHPGSLCRWAVTRLDTRHTITVSPLATGRLLYTTHLEPEPALARAAREKFALRLYEDGVIDLDLVLALSGGSATEATNRPLGYLHNAAALLAFLTLVASLAWVPHSIRGFLERRAVRRALRHLRCPRCGYSLVGLERAICPECGAALPLGDARGGDAPAHSRVR